jgi:hypothetical protein
MSVLLWNGFAIFCIPDDIFIIPAGDNATRRTPIYNLRDMEIERNN